MNFFSLNPDEALIIIIKIIIIVIKFKITTIALYFFYYEAIKLKQLFLILNIYFLLSLQKLKNTRRTRSNRLFVINKEKRILYVIPNNLEYFIELYEKYAKIQKMH